MGAVFALQLVGIGLAIVAGLLLFLWKLVHFRPRHVVSFFEVLGGVIVGMLMRDRWGEVFDTIKRNKLRTALTAVSVAWGIFVMVVLLGLGHGLNNGVRHSFRRQATNAIYMSANKTSIPWAGYGLGRRLMFDNRDYERAKRVDGVEHLSGQYFIHGNRFDGIDIKVSRGAKSNAFSINAVHPEALYLSGEEILQGRFLNSLDVAMLRKVCVIGRPVADFLFGPTAEERAAGATGPVDPVGQWINVGSVAFEVVGVFGNEGSEEQERQLYIPVSTAQLAFNGADKLGMLMMTVGDADVPKSKAIADAVVAQLSTAHQFSPDDKQAVRVFNTVEASETFRMLFVAISAFVVLIGCGTLLAAGVGAIEVIPWLFDTDMIRNPSVDIGVGVAAAIGLVLAGALAGFVPARAAARINPVHTLRDA